MKQITGMRQYQSSQREAVGKNESILNQCSLYLQRRLIRSSNERNESIVPIFGMDHMGDRISCG